jgi:hypothetical protein
MRHDGDDAWPACSSSAVTVRQRVRVPIIHRSNYTLKGTEEAE